MYFLMLLLMILIGDIYIQFLFLEKNLSLDQVFKDFGLLKYLFKSLEKYLPWINKLHMIVMSDSQVPKWINRENVNIIYHSDFIPKKYLPTFSSHTIELNLHRIKTLSENFVFFNDDFFYCTDKSVHKVKVYGVVLCGELDFCFEK